MHTVTKQFTKDLQMWDLFPNQNSPLGFNRADCETGLRQ